eukprot:6201154-Pleurochrysis_carterae.AAC.2
MGSLACCSRIACRSSALPRSRSRNAAPPSSSCSSAVLNSSSAGAWASTETSVLRPLYTSNSCIIVVVTSAVRLEWRRRMAALDLCCSDGMSCRLPLDKAVRESMYVET